MAVKKGTTNKGTTKKKKVNTRAASGRATSSSIPAESLNKGLLDEIILLSVLAISIVLLLSNFGIGGKLGSSVAYLFFGLFGFLSFIFPLVLFLSIAFYLANRESSLIKKRIIVFQILFLLLCACTHLLMVDVTSNSKILDSFVTSASEKTGGGLLGGTIAILLNSGFGVVGSYAIIIIAIFICLIILTQKPLIKQLANRGQEAYHTVRADRERRTQERSLFAETTLEKPKTNKKQQGVSGEVQPNNEDALAIFPHENQQQKGLPKDSIQNSIYDLSESFEKELENEIMDQVLQIQRAESITTEQEEKSDDNFDKKLEVGESFESDDVGVQGVIHFPGENTRKNRGQQVVPAPNNDVHEITAPSPSKRNHSSKQEIDAEVDSIDKEIKVKEVKPKPAYHFPPLSLLKPGVKTEGESDQQLQATARKLQQTLHSFGVNVTVTNVSCGPTVTRYELQPEQGVKVSRITNLADDIKLNLAAEDIRIEAPIPGKAAVGIEVPNMNNSVVYLRDLLQSKAFHVHKSNLAFAAGKDIAGNPVITDIAKMPHLLIAGATGSGKSVCINTLIMSILYKASPDDVKLIMIDPKVVELSIYNGIPHLFIPVVTDPKKAAGALNWAVAEMNDRYNKFAQYNVRDLQSYNQKVESIADIEEEGKPEKLPQIVIIVDELADLMMVAPGEVEDAICRLAQLARAGGIHLILATQRPSVNVITGLIKANMPSRIAFSVSSGVDSRTILDSNGAEKLLGKGDMLFYPQGYTKPARVQGAFVSDKEVQDVVNFLTEQSHSDGYNQEVVDKINLAGNSATSASSPTNELDAYFVDAGKFIIEKDKASIGMLQRVFKIGFNRAARIMDQLCEAGVVGEEEGTKPRKVIMTLEQFENYIEESL